MKLQSHILIALFSLFFQLSFGQTEVTVKQNNILKVHMNLSAMGVESDDFPSIDATIDFTENTNMCVKSFYNPAYDGSTYYLTTVEIEAIKTLLENADLSILKEEYTVPVSDQPTSFTQIVTADKTYTIMDYGLKGHETLTKLYKLVYRIYE